MIKRLDVANTLGNRGAVTTQDEKLVNGYAEVDSDLKRRKAVKRPGLVNRYSLGTGQAGATIGQGIFAFTTIGTPTIASAITLIGIRGDVLTRPVS